MTKKQNSLFIKVILATENVMQALDKLIASLIWGGMDKANRVQIIKAVLQANALNTRTI